MLNWRYHFLSLAAVFLALALGIIVGIGLSDSGAIETGQTDLISDIRANLDELSTRNSQLEREQAINSTFQKDVYPFLIGGRLQGRQYALVMSSTVPEEIRDSVVSSINVAGAQVISTTVLDPRFNAGEMAEKINEAMAADPAFSKVDAATAAGWAGEALAPEIARVAEPRLLQLLKGSFVTSFSGNYAAPVNGVILLTYADNEQAPAYAEFEKQFVTTLRKSNVRVVAGETTKAPVSEIAMFQNTETSTVDNLDSRIGQISLVFALGGEGGSFGVKQTADMLIPILREPGPLPPAGP